MSKRRKKRKASDRLGVEAALEALKGELADLAHRVEALGALTQKEGAWRTKTFARFLEVSTRTLKDMIRDGRVPYHRVGGSIRFTPGDRERFLEETAQPPQRRKGGKDGGKAAEPPQRRKGAKEKRHGG